MFHKKVGLGLQNEPQRHSPSQLIEGREDGGNRQDGILGIHDMRHSLTAIYANAEILERDHICASERADLLFGIQEAVLDMTERIDSLLQFGRSGRKHPLVHERVSLIVEKAVRQ